MIRTSISKKEAIDRQTIALLFKTLKKHSALSIDETMERAIELFNKTGK